MQTDTINIEQCEQELLAAGWTRKQIDIWMSPRGLMYRGLYRAWQIMKTHPELNTPRML